MTTAQWLFEFEALKERERVESEKISTIIKIFRITLIKLLGLDLMNDKLKENEDIEKKIDELAFVPLSILAGRRETVEYILDKMDKDEKAARAITDDNFEKMSLAIASGDMEPVLDGIPSVDIIKNALNDEEHLKKLGITLVDTIPNVPHIETHIKKEEPTNYTVKFDDNA